MPGIDFNVVRSSVSIAQVLDLIGFEPAVSHGDQLRGRCPVHGSNSPRSKSFSVNLTKHRYQCFKCGSAGGQLELWAAVRGITVYQAALDLCEQLGVEVPWIRRW
jgi:DNA primase